MERPWYPDQQIEKLADDSIILKLTTNQQTQTLFQVAQWGSHAEILKPEELRQKAGKWFFDCAERYN